MASSSTCTTPKAQRIDKIERQIIDGKLTLVDDGGNPLPKVVSTKNVDSDSEVEYVVDDPAVFMASTGLKRGTDSGYGNMKMEPNIENMTMNVYLEYEAAKERQLWDDVRSRRSPTNYDEADVDSFNRNKSKTFSFTYSHNLTPPHPCFLPVQPCPTNYLVSTNESNDVDIENMTIAEYNLYVAKQSLEMNPLSNHSYGFTPQFFSQPPHTSNTSKKDSDFHKILDDLFRTGAENMMRMGQDIVQDNIWEPDDDLEEDQKDDGNDRDTFDIWDITVEDVERIRQFFTPNVDVIENVIQPLIPKTLHTTPPNEDYMAPATKSILDDLLEEFGDEILNVTMVDEGAKSNPAKDLEELERLLAKEPQNMASSSTCTTPKAQGIDKIERQIIDGKLTLVDDDGKPLPKVAFTKNEDSDSEVEYVVDDPTVFMASTGLKRGADSGYGTNSLLE
ncbi:hypothetical protein Tco_1053606 [Tanacetum coccineum]|uniref:Uncharacterized protein n=1 Tax=Tanacetum coccineum TaxID=301880 RepID=A0ABQ5GVB0_9ASTR